jgi:hypothetical protein
MGSAWPLVTHMPSGLTDLTKAICTTTEKQKRSMTLGSAQRATPSRVPLMPRTSRWRR